MSTQKQPRILYLYDKLADKKRFETHFGEHFEVPAFDNRESALAFLESTEQDIAALVVEQKDVDATLLQQFKRQCPRGLSIRVHEDFSLDEIISLLESGMVDRCFARPYPSERIRSEILSNALTQPKNAIPDNTAEATEKAGYKTLIVDDESVATRFLKKQLKKLNCPSEVLVADSAEQALEIYDEYGSDLALVISDQRMPGKQGHQLLNEIAKRNPATIRMLTSAYEEVDVALNAVNEGHISHYIKKPWQADEINSLVSDALEIYGRNQASLRDQRADYRNQYEQVIQTRKSRLTKQLTETFPQVDLVPALTTFWDILATVKTLPPGPAAIRASEKTDLENELVDSFVNLIAPQLSRIESLLADRVIEPESFWAEVQRHLSDASDQPNAIRDAHPLINMLISDLSALCESLGRVELQWQTASKDQHQGLMLESPGKLTMYKHFLSAHTSLSHPMLEQQCKLFIVVLLSRILGVDLETSGGEYRFAIRLWFPVDETRGNSFRPPE